ncbi:hypothetical protein HMI56_000316 [Coelomomyces lativittatus]|nr:hypothetical protein HMI56_000316 [Coelomomyces lativittatus]
MTISESITESKSSPLGIVHDPNFPNLNLFLIALQYPDSYFWKDENSRCISPPNSIWTLKTKYYSAKIETHVVTLENEKYLEGEALPSSEALCILHSSKESMSNSLLHYINSHSAETKLIVFPTMPSEDLIPDIHPTVAEIVYLDKKIEQDFRAKTSIKRVREALETTKWSSMIIESNDLFSFSVDEDKTILEIQNDSDSVGKHDEKEKDYKQDKEEELKGNPDDDDDELSNFFKSDSEDFLKYFEGGDEFISLKINEIFAISKYSSKNTTEASKEQFLSRVMDRLEKM